MRLNLKLAILAAGKSQRQIAAASGVPENKLSEFIRGWKDPSDGERASIAAALGKSQVELFGAAETQPGCVG